MKEGRISYEYWARTLSVSLPLQPIGQGILRLQKESLFLKRQILGVGISHRYEIEHIKDFRFVPATSGKSNSPSGILFAYKGKQVCFGAGLNDQEGKRVLELMEMSNNTAFQTLIKAAVFKLYPF